MRYPIRLDLEEQTPASYFAVVIPIKFRGSNLLCCDQASSFLPFDAPGGRYVMQQSFLYKKTLCLEDIFSFIVLKSSIRLSVFFYHFF